MYLSPKLVLTYNRVKLTISEVFTVQRHEKINRCFADINRCLTNILKT